MVFTLITKCYPREYVFSDLNIAAKSKEKTQDSFQKVS